MQEVNLSLYPVLVVALSRPGAGTDDASESRAAAMNAVEQVPRRAFGGVRGSRDEAIEIIVEPTLLKAYNFRSTSSLSDSTPPTA